MPETHQETLAMVRKGAGRDGVYALAQRLRRPYRRVLDNVRALEERGLLRTQPAENRGREILRVLPAARHDTPRLEYVRQWSAPGKSQPPEVVIASVLARPTFRDLVAVAKTFGLPAVNDVYRSMVERMELPAVLATEDARMLRNIEAGFARARR